MLTCTRLLPSGVSVGAHGQPVGLLQCLRGSSHCPHPFCAGPCLEFTSWLKGVSLLPPAMRVLILGDGEGGSLLGAPYSDPEPACRSLISRLQGGEVTLALVDPSLLACRSSVRTVLKQPYLLGRDRGSEPPGFGDPEVPSEFPQNSASPRPCHCFG